MIDDRDHHRHRLAGTFPAHPISPVLPESREQNAAVIAAATRAAAAFASRGYAVFLDGIVGPWFLPVVAAELESTAIPVEYVVLRVSLAEAIRRATTRAQPGPEAVVRHMHAAFENLGAYPSHVLDTTALSIDDMVATDGDTFRDAQARGLLWVALADDTAVGFALVEMLSADAPHLDEIDVHPRHGRRGLGTALVRAVCDWAARAGHRQVTLTTFRMVPWNMPFYLRLGFEEIPATEMTPELLAVVRDETSRGLDPGARVVLRWRTR